MPTLDRSVATLRFFGDDLDPDELTLLLGAPPTEGVRKGDTRTFSSGSSRTYRQGSWRLRAAERSPADLDAQIAELLDTFTEDLTVWRQLARYRPNLFCGLFLVGSNEGISISPKSLRKLGERGIELGLDIYGADGSEGVDDTTEAQS